MPKATLVFAALLVALSVNVGMLALSAALLAMMVRSFIAARRYAAAGSPGDGSRR